MAVSTPALRMLVGALAEQVGAEHHGRHGRAHQEVDRPRHLVVAGAGVEHDAVCRDVQPIAQLDGTVALPVAVDGVGEGVAALRHQGPQLGAHLPLGLGDQPLEGVLRARPAKAGEQLAEAPFAQPDGGHGGARVALHHLGEARVAVEEPQQLFDDHALARHPHGRHDDALLVDVGAVGRQRARAHAADVVEMRPRLGEGGQLPFREHRGHEHLVGRVRDRPLGGVAVVEPVDVAGTHGVEWVDFGDGADHVAEHRQVGADDQPAGAVEQRGVEVLLLTDEGRHGRALDHRLHLALDRPKRPAHDLQRDGIADDYRGLCRILRHLPLFAPAPDKPPVTAPEVCPKVLGRKILCGCRL